VNLGDKVTRIAIVDLDSDEIAEIVCSAESAQVVAVEGNGAILWQAAFPAGSADVAVLATDSEPLLVAAAGSAGLLVLNGSGKAVAHAPTDGSAGHVSWSGNQAVVTTSEGQVQFFLSLPARERLGELQTKLPHRASHQPGCFGAAGLINGQALICRSLYEAAAAGFVHSARLVGILLVDYHPRENAAGVALGLERFFEIAPKVAESIPGVLDRLGLLVGPNPIILSQFDEVHSSVIVGGSQAQCDTEATVLAAGVQVSAFSIEKYLDTVVLLVAVVVPRDSGRKDQSDFLVRRLMPTKIGLTPNRIVHAEIQEPVVIGLPDGI